MELRQLTYFVAVCEELSFSRAATRCFISQSAVSHQISRLERDLGAPLFDRSTRSVVPTDAAVRLLPLAKQMIGLEAAIRAAVRTRGDRIRLAATMSFATRSLSAIARARDAHPDAEIEFVIKPFRQRITAVVEGDCDLALIRGGLDEPGLATERLWVEDLVVAASPTHPLARRIGVRPADLRPYPLLLPPEPDQVLLHTVVRAAFTDVGPPTYGPPVPADRSAAVELINRPDAWTLLYADSPTEGLVALRLERRLRIPVAAVFRRDTRPSPVFTTLLAGLQPHPF